MGPISDDDMSHCLPSTLGISAGVALVGQKQRRGRTSTIMKALQTARAG